MTPFFYRRVAWLSSWLICHQVPMVTDLLSMGTLHMPSSNISCPYPSNNITVERRDFNKAMSELRQGVEYGFGKVVHYFGFVDFKKNQKVYLQPLGPYYRFAVLFTNVHTCLYGSAMNSLFNSSPPSLENYLALMEE